MRVINHSTGYAIEVTGTIVPVRAIRTTIAACGDNTVLAIKIVRDFTGLGLAEARDVLMFIKMAQSLS